MIQSLFQVGEKCNNYKTPATWQCLTGFNHAGLLAHSLVTSQCLLVFWHTDWLLSGLVGTGEWSAFTGTDGPLIALRSSCCPPLSEEPDKSRPSRVLMTPRWSPPAVLLKPHNPPLLPCLQLAVMREGRQRRHTESHYAFMLSVFTLQRSWQ